MANYNWGDKQPSEWVEGDVITIPYAASERSASIPTGTYQFELIGGSVNNGSYSRGGYTIGKYQITASSETLYFHTGGKGTQNTSTSTYAGGGYNGGGGSIANSNYNFYGGGGATHIAKVSGLLSTLSSHATNGNIIGVAGGAGGYFVTSYAGGNGGGMSGSTGGGYKKGAGTSYTTAGAGTQQEGGTRGYAQAGPNEGYGTAGAFGQGGRSGGGGGYYGGGGGIALNATFGQSNVSGSGGSGYIGGFTSDGQTSTPASVMGDGNGYIVITVIALSKTLTVTYNVTTIINEPKSGDVSYSYGSVTGTISINQTKTMQCNGKVCSSDIVIGGKTLQCNGELMASDVVINYS